MADLFETARDEDGVGIAAPQVGININIAVVDSSCGGDPAARSVRRDGLVTEALADQFDLRLGRIGVRTLGVENRP